MLSEEAFQQLVLKVHEAAIDASQWNGVVESVAAAFGATSALLMTPGEADTHERFLWSNFGLDPRNQAEYGSHWATEDPWLKIVRERRMSLTSGVLQIGESYLPRSELRRTAFYNEYAATTGIEGLATLVIEGQTAHNLAPFTVLSLLRRPGMESFSADGLRKFQALHPHLHQAIRTHWLLTATRQRAFRDALDVSPLPMFLLSSDAEIDYANRVGECLLKSSTVTRHNQGKLESIGRMEPGSLRNAIKLAARGVGQVITTWWPEADARFRTAVVRLTPLDARVCSGAAGLRSAVLVTVELQEPSLRARAVLEATAFRYRLTPAEIRVLDAIQRGLLVEEAAEEFKVQVSTLRTHLASLLHKTGCRKQSDLLRLDDAR